jgi:hypothetical protein
MITLYTSNDGFFFYMDWGVLFLFTIPMCFWIIRESLKIRAEIKEHRSAHQLSSSQQKSATGSDANLLSDPLMARQ